MSPDKIRDTKLFFYGTLLPGQKNYHRVEEAIKTGDAEFLCNDATTPDCTLVWMNPCVGCGDYPGLLSSGNTSVTGQVYAVSEEFLRACDEFEGHPTIFYSRERIFLTNTFGAWTYITPEKWVTPVRHEIPSGSWVQFMEERRKTEQLEADQKIYTD